MRKTKNGHMRDFFIGAMIGSAIGALTTTKTGHKVQKKLAEKYHDFEDFFKGLFQMKKIRTRSGRRSRR